MALAMPRRQRARRRLAALAFLSSISLDGTYRDTKLNTLIKQPSSQSNHHYQKQRAARKHHKKPQNHHGHSASRHHDRYPASRPAELIKSNSSAAPDDSDHRDEDDRQDSDKVAQLNTNATTNFLNRRSGELSSQRRSRVLSVSSHESTNSKFLADQSRAREKIRNKRIVLLSAKRAPIAIFSLLTPSRNHEKEFGPDGIASHQTSGLNQTGDYDPTDLFTIIGLERPGGQDISYGHIFEAPASNDGKHLNNQQQNISSTIRPASHYLTSVSGDGSSQHCGCPTEQLVSPWPANMTRPLRPNEPVIYHASLLDDPTLIAGKHSTVLAFPSYITSIIDYVKPSDMKRELNERFRARFPHLQLSLSKLRSLKREMYKIARVDHQLDYATVAQAYVYFEKLCLKHLVNKQDRKLCAGASLLISAKLNDVKGAELKSLIESIETSFRVKRKDLITIEFGVVVALGFSLHLTADELIPHYERLINMS